MAALYQTDDWYVLTFLTLWLSLDLIQRMTITLLFQVLISFTGQLQFLLHKLTCSLVR